MGILHVYLPTFGRYMDPMGNSDSLISSKYLVGSVGFIHLKFDSSSLKNDGWKMSLSFADGNFSGANC